MAFCEVSKWCNDNALKTNWPKIPNLNNVKKLCTNSEDKDGEGIGTKEFKVTYGDIDLITAGVPCQPASIIGKRKGIKDSRWLWPDTFRIIKELRPTWVICENPTGLLTLDGGDRFGEIIKGFSQAGYECWWETIPASAVGGNHRRERVWIIAYSPSEGLERHSRVCNSRDKSRRINEDKVGRTSQKVVLPLRNTSEWWKDKPPIPIVVNGIPDPTFWKEAVIATGNAIVPQVAYEILRTLKIRETYGSI